MIVAKVPLRAFPLSRQTSRTLAASIRVKMQDGLIRFNPKDGTQHFTGFTEQLGRPLVILPDGRISWGKDWRSRKKLGEHRPDLRGLQTWKAELARKLYRSVKAGISATDHEKLSDP